MCLLCLSRVLRVWLIRQMNDGEESLKKPGSSLTVWVSIFRYDLTISRQCAHIPAPWWHIWITSGDSFVFVIIRWSDKTSSKQVYMEKHILYLDCKIIIFHWLCFRCDIALHRPTKNHTTVSVRLGPVHYLLVRRCLLWCTWQVTLSYQDNIS